MNTVSPVNTRVFDIRAFGAVGDGKTLDTATVQRAIDACSADGGGVVLVPAGEFLIAPIELKANVTLRIAASGKLVATTDPALYHEARGIPLQGDHTMADGNVGLVYAANADNVTLEGPGTIDGRGKAVRDAGIGGRHRPHLVLFYKCNNLAVRDIYLHHSAYHTLRIANCEHVQLDGIRINSRVVGNNDGFHFISAQHVHVSNCDVRCQDDACALFGDCRFVTVNNCTFSTRWSVFRFGGGSVAENIAVSNCVLDQVYGCPIKLRCGPGSRYENMSFSNLILKDVTGPISIGAGPQRENGTSAGAPASRPTTGPYANWPGGVVRNISFSNIRGNVITSPQPLDDSTFTGSKNPGELHSAIDLNAVDGTYLENISFNDIHLTFGGGGTLEEGARRELPQIAGEYFALGPIPAYGLYARNVRGLSMNNVRLRVATPELRPAIILDKVQGATLNGLSIDANEKAECAIRVMNASDVLLSRPRLLSPAAVFLRVEGERCRDITLDGGDTSKAQSVTTFAAGADQRSAIRRPR